MIGEECREEEPKAEPMKSMDEEEEEEVDDDEDEDDEEECFEDAF